VAGPTGGEVCEAAGWDSRLLNQPVDSLREWNPKGAAPSRARPFGVNSVAAPDTRAAPDPAGIPRHRAGGAGDARPVPASASPRRAPLPPAPRSRGRPHRGDPEERVPVWSIGLGDPGAARFAAATSGVSRSSPWAPPWTLREWWRRRAWTRVVAQGSEAGGHRSTWGEAREPRGRRHRHHGAGCRRCAEAVTMPVIAAGGMRRRARPGGGPSRWARAAVLLGTRFVATRESGAPSSGRRPCWSGGATAPP
jgi:hypothetical protein